MSAAVTPWNPSATARRKVKDQLTAPRACPYCPGQIHIVSLGDDLESRYGIWPWVYACRECEASVGMHPRTDIPLGTLADAPTRDERRRARLALKTLYLTGLMSAGQAHERHAFAQGAEPDAFCIELLGAHELALARDLIRDIYLMAVIDHLEPVLEPWTPAGTLELLRQNRHTTDTVILEAWAEEDLALARLGGLAVNDAFEIADSKAAFEALLPACLAEDYKALLGVLNAANREPGSAEEADGHLAAIDDAWTAFGEAAYAFRATDITHRFALAMPELWSLPAAWAPPLKP